MRLRWDREFDLQRLLLTYILTSTIFIFYFFFLFVIASRFWEVGLIMGQREKERMTEQRLCMDEVRRLCEGRASCSVSQLLQQQQKLKTNLCSLGQACLDIC